MHTTTIEPKKFDESLDKYVNQLKTLSMRYTKTAKKLNERETEKLRKEAKELRIATIERRIDVLTFGFNHIDEISKDCLAKVSDNTTTVRNISEKMDIVLNEAEYMRNEHDTREIEILNLRQMIHRQDKEIEALKDLIAEQQSLIEKHISRNTDASE